MENHFAAVSRAVVELVADNRDLFLVTGRRMFDGFAAVLIVWTGVRIALSGRGMDFGRFAGVLLTISFGFSMIAFYDRPIPGIGFSFTDLIVEQALSLANRLEGATFEDIQLRLHEVYVSMERPGLNLFAGVQWLRYAVTVVLIALAQGLLLAVISYGYVAMGVIVLVGPLFVPFFIVPHLEWLFWGWFRAFIQYSFYQVIGHAFVFVFGAFLVEFLEANAPPFDGPRFAVLFLPFAFLLVAFIFGLLQVPRLTANIFSGRAGDGAALGAVGAAGAWLGARGRRS